MAARNVVWQADKIINGVEKIAELLHGDAPIAADREHHVITSFQQTAAASGRHAAHPWNNPTDKKDKKKPQPQGGGAPPAGQAQPGGAGTKREVVQTTSK